MRRRQFEEKASMLPLHEARWGNEMKFEERASMLPLSLGKIGHGNECSLKKAPVSFSTKFSSIQYTRNQPNLIQASIWIHVDKYARKQNGCNVTVSLCKMPILFWGINPGLPQFCFQLSDMHRDTDMHTIPTACIAFFFSQKGAAQ